MVVDGAGRASIARRAARMSLSQQDIFERNSFNYAPRCKGEGGVTFQNLLKAARFILVRRTIYATKSPHQAIRRSGYRTARCRRPVPADWLLGKLFL